ncbi:glycosyltransferase family 2 protein [Aminobacter sp. HY435]|uniref:glycosyltransferase family 2 protein n=1 Tax=Aminobacter sp. HY435 TaxID=2970917 RepID=UPI0022B9587A|nr:glycosyltransferase family 2 protein [Aminobacter sp. HY435]
MREAGLTVAICTRNRAPLLARCLSALEAAGPPDAPFEILVVANDCSDDTLAVAGGFRSRLPIVVVEEPVAGLSSARNRAVAEARGRLIVWLDDDALAHKALLRAYEAAMLASPECAIFGGAIYPCFEGEPPDWLVAGLSAVESAYAARRPGAAERFDRVNSNLPFGANYAVKTEVQRRFSFDLKLGRRPDNPLSGGEEVAMIRQALAAGYVGRWVPEAAVDHLIGPERQSEAWLWCYFHAEGVRVAGGEPPNLWLRLKAARAVRRYRHGRTRLPAEQWLALLVRAAILAGRAGVSPRL